MTGILPIKKYGSHSTINMFNEYSMTNPGKYAEYKGNMLLVGINYDKKANEGKHHSCVIKKA